MKRAASYFLALFLLPAIALGQDLPAKYIAALSETGAGLSRGLTFHAPFTDPANPLTLYRGTGPLTFTRAHDATHTAYYFHALNGYLTAADNNQLRIEAAGALLEPVGATNYITNSRDLAVWTTNGLTITKNLVGMDGVDNSAYTLSTATGHYLASNATVLGSAAYTLSVYLKRTDATDTGTIQLSLDGLATSTEIYLSTIPVGVWTRYTKTQTLANPSFAAMVNGPVTNLGFDNPQVEAGSAATSVIVTGATAMTRNADVLTAPAVNSNTGAITISATATPKTGIPGTIMLSHSDGTYTGTHWELWISAGANLVFTTANGSATFNGNANTVMAGGSTTNIAGRYTAAKVVSAFGSGTTTSDGTLTGTQVDTTDPIRFGARGDAYSPFWGHLKNVRIWNRALSDDEMESVTR